MTYRDFNSLGAGEAMVIAEQVLAAITESSRYASDRAGVILAAAADLAAAHQQACRACASDPVLLADFLAARMLSAGDDELVDPADYADLLGDEGMARLRERVTAAWTANPAGWPERYAMERILRLQGDVDGRVAMLAQDLDRRGLGHLQIIRELGSGRPRRRGALLGRARTAMGRSWLASGSRPGNGR